MFWPPVIRLTFIVMRKTRVEASPSHIHHRGGRSSSFPSSPLPSLLLSALQAHLHLTCGQGGSRAHRTGAHSWPVPGQSRAGREVQSVGIPGQFPAGPVAVLGCTGQV